jgi:hypothetical protein
MLIILKDKILSARHIDDVTSAELPDRLADPELLELVLQHMLHIRCDEDDSVSCRRDDHGRVCACKRFFPKEACTTTMIVPDGYPKYRRRCLHTATLPGGRIVSDNWVVPHNRFLLLKYRAHCNVEICAHFKSFKYVYKYAFKAPDSTSVCVDEIDAFLAGRLLSASEAVHRLLSLKLHKEWPTVTRLDIHLPHQQRLVFDPTADEQELLAQVTSASSTLMAWFDLNSVDINARNLLYHEIPEKYAWVDSRWVPRTRDGISVGRIYGVSANNSELYALRRLLSAAKGAQSFEDLASFNGQLHSTFRAACQARGLFANDVDLVAAFQEITEVEVCVDRIRRQFARMLVHSAPVDPQALFNHFVDDLCDGPVDDNAVDAALLSIESMMNAMGRSLADSNYGFALPDPDGASARVRSSRRRVDALAQMSRAEAQIEADRLLPLFTAEQSDAMQKVLLSVRSQQACNVFVLLSSAGCGKTAFANGVSAHVRANGGTVVSVAASAMAAMLLTGGRTAHSALHIPIPAHDASICNLSHEEREALHSADIIIYDEVSMVHEHVADTVDRSLRDVMHDDRPFGGKTVILMGDFKQLLPVVRYGQGHQHTVQKCAWWKHVQHLKFTKNWRAAEHPDYVEFLENVGNGVIETVQVPHDRVVPDVERMIDNVYGNHFAPGNQILALTLETCATVNQACLERLPGDVVECPSADTYEDCADPDQYPHDYVESLQIPGAPPFKLHLKIGARYMCIRNLDMQRGLINGTMLQLLQIGQRFLQFRIMNGSGAGGVEMVMKSVFAIAPEASGLPFTISRRQYPIISAYCLSVHKAQGQSLKHVGLIFESDPFTHGQLYVALSRVACWLCVTVMLHSQQYDIRNLVLKHLL